MLYGSIPSISFPETGVEYMRARVVTEILVAATFPTEHRTNRAIFRQPAHLEKKENRPIQKNTTHAHLIIPTLVLLVR